MVEIDPRNDEISKAGKEADPVIELLGKRVSELPRGSITRRQYVALIADVNEGTRRFSGHAETAGINLTRLPGGEYPEIPE